MKEVSSKLKRFYEDHIRLGSVRRNQLAKHRNDNIDRLKSGLDALGEKHGCDYAYPKEVQDQGSYAMVTMNQHRDNAYDIDVALIFNADDLPEDAREARVRICGAFNERPRNFRQPAKARDNAVTVWYADGYHLDFAIYRRRSVFWGEVIEHAGADGWRKRNPEEISDWFHGAVDDLSPWLLADVEKKQLRRIVRFLKWFCKSRSSWDMPGGMIVSTLAVECYVADNTRDDVALYNTMAKLAKRLAGGCHVKSPVADEWLTEKDKNYQRVCTLKAQLDKAIEKLAILLEDDCTDQQAFQAWNYVFNHDFWKEAADGAAKASSTGGLLRPAAAVGGLFTFPDKPVTIKKPAGFA
jgi:hypothetical protein